MELILGARYRYEDFDLFAQYKYSDSSSLLGLGLTYIPAQLPHMSFSAGYKPYLVDKSVESNMTLGFSIGLNTIEFHYAQEFSENKLFENKHYFSILVNF